MSVPKSLRGESKLEVLTKSRELAAYTVKICSNENNFPKRYRWCVTQDIVQCAVDVTKYVAMANSIYVVNDDDYRLRRKYQQEALANVSAMLNLISIARDVFQNIDGRRLTYWAEKAMEVQNLIRTWKKSDERNNKVDG